MKTLNASRRRRAAIGGITTALVAVAISVGSPAQAADPDPNHLTVVYDVTGSAHIGAQINSDLDLGPTNIKVTIDTAAPLPTPIIDGSMVIPPKVINFSILGIPARAKVTMTQVGPITGTLTKLPAPRQALDLKSKVKYDIRLSDVEAKIGAWFPLAVGSRCHTAEPVTINVGSPLSTTTPPTGFFTINAGGPATGAFTIGQFTGCAPLNFLDIPGFFPWFGSIPINSLVPGSNNTASLNLSNPQPGS